VNRIVDKLKQKEKAKVKMPILEIYDSMRCSVIVDSLQDLEEVVDLILKDREGITLQVKPKLDNPMLMNVTIHCSRWPVKGKTVAHPMVGEIQVILKSERDPVTLLAMHAHYELVRSLESFTDNLETRGELSLRTTATIGRLTFKLIDLLS